MAGDVLQRIRETLMQAGVAFKEISHAPTHTSEESARVRGESLAVGVKALLLKTDDKFRLFVLPARIGWPAAVLGLVGILVVGSELLHVTPSNRGLLATAVSVAVASSPIFMFVTL